MGLPVQLESAGREFHGELPPLGHPSQDAATDDAGARHLDRAGTASLRASAPSLQRRIARSLPRLRRSGRLFHSLAPAARFERGGKIGVGTFPDLPDFSPRDSPGSRHLVSVAAPRPVPAEIVDNFVARARGPGTAQLPSTARPDDGTIDRVPPGGHGSVRRRAAGSLRQRLAAGPLEPSGNAGLALPALPGGANSRGLAHGRSGLAPSQRPVLAPP